MLMIAVGTLTAFAGGRPEVITEAAFSGAVSAVQMVIEMTGIIMLWMGVLKLAEKSGLVSSLGKILQPVIGRLFPSLPKNSAALGSIIMNISANFLGLGNAATPFGLKAMEDLQRLNSDKKKASDDMITFLILNTSAVTLIPTMVIGLRVESGSAAPEEIILPALLAGIVGLTAGLFCHKLLKRFF
jgi:spore maturation protein A